MANSAGFVADLHAQYADAVSSFSRDGERTVAILEGLLPVARGNGEEELVANGWVLLARCLVDLGLPARAHRELDALQNWLVLHPRWLAQLAESHDFRAQIYLAGNQLAEAEAQWLHCLDYALARQAVTLYFAASLGLGDVARLEGSVEEGQAWHVLALDFSRILGDDNLLARGVLYVLADLAALRQHGAVVEMSLRNEPLLQRCHETSWLADLYTYRARALLAQGDRQRADAALEQAGHLAGEHGFAWSRANALLGLARAQLEQHNPLFARVLLDEIGQLMEKMSGKSPVQSLRVEFDELQQWCAQAQEGGRAAEVAAPGARTNAPREAVFSSRRLQVWHALNLEKCRLS